MSLSDLASLGSFVSGVAVLVSLVYLSLQIRQNTKHSRALIQQGRAARIADTAMRVAELRADDGLNKCFDGAPDISSKDLGRFLNICRAVFVSAEDSFLQKQQGLLDDLAFESFQTSVRAGMNAPGMGAGWLITRDLYEPQFRKYIDDNLGDAPHKAARPLSEWKAALTTRTGV